MPEGIANILKQMLQKRQSDRPNINQILGIDEVAKRIPKLLSRNIFVEEFSHTILHNQHVFKKMSLSSLASVSEEETEKDLLMRWATGSYKPQNGLNPVIFDYAMQFYMNHLSDSLKLKKTDD